MEALRIVIVHPLNVEDNWPIVEPYILAAIGIEAQPCDLEYIKRQALTGNARIWIVQRNFNIEAVLVTETVFYGGKKTLVIRWASGKGKLMLCKDIMDSVETYAYHEGYERLEAWGSKGWERILQPLGFRHEFTIVGKFLAKRMH